MLLLPLWIQAQTLTITNGDKVLTVSNGNVVATASLITNAPPLVMTTNGVVIPQAFLAELANTTGIPIECLNILPLKVIVWIVGIAVCISLIRFFSSALRKIIPDNLQVNQLGLWLAHLAGEVNPSIEKLAAAAKPTPTQQISPIKPVGPVADTTKAP